MRSELSDAYKLDGKSLYPLTFRHMINDVCKSYGNLKGRKLSDVLRTVLTCNVCL